MISGVRSNMAWLYLVENGAALQICNCEEYEI